MKPTETEAKHTPRSIESLSLLNPLNYDDALELEGPEGGNLWIVNRSASGWYLHKPESKIDRHPSIHSLDGMAEFIGAILEWAGGYSK